MAFFYRGSGIIPARLGFDIFEVIRIPVVWQIFQTDFFFSDPFPVLGRQVRKDEGDGSTPQLIEVFFIKFKNLGKKKLFFLAIEVESFLPVSEKPPSLSKSFDPSKPYQANRVLGKYLKR